VGIQFGANAWTDEQASVLIELIAAGKSSAEVATALNAQFGTAYTRNSVIGKCNRLKLDRPDKPKAAPRPRATRHRAVVKLVANGGGGLRVHTSRANADELKLRCIEIECVTPFADVTGCRGVPADGPTLFCNGPVQEGSSYCTAHHALYWVPPRPSEHKSWRPAA